MSRARALKTLAKLVSKQGKRTAPSRPKERLKGPVTSKKMMLYGSQGSKHREKYIRKSVAAYDKQVGRTKFGFKKKATYDFEDRQYERVKKVIGERKKAFSDLGRMPRVTDRIPKSMMRHMSKLPPEPTAMAKRRTALLNKARGIQSKKGTRLRRIKRRR